MYVSIIHYEEEEVAYGLSSGTKMVTVNDIEQYQLTHKHQHPLSSVVSANWATTPNKGAIGFEPTTSWFPHTGQ